MVSKGYKRKLTTIMSADVVGYSRLMGEDETSTIDTLTSYRGIMAELIKQHRGRVVDSPGDNVLAEFSSVVDAVQCGVSVQKEFQARNTELPENRRMEFRVGINLGDVIEEEGRIYGDGVNIAARLEGLADPGGICVSKTAFDQIETKLPLGYEYLGEQPVKNIAKPVGAYRVLMEPRVTVAEEKKEAEVIPFWRRKAAMAGAVAVLVVIIGVAVWNVYLRPPPIEPASVENMAYPLPDKPSIAVLPFDNLSDDPGQGYLPDAITENIISALSTVPELFVIARTSSFVYKGKPVKVQKVAEDLGVRYVLEGSVQISGESLRITAQLIDALKGHHLWSQRYDRKLKNIFVLQDDIALEIVAALRVKLTAGERARLAARRTDNLEAYLKLLQASESFYTVTREGNAMARRLSEEVIALDPKFPGAYVLLGGTHFMDVPLGLSKSIKESYKQAFQLTKKAIHLDESYATAYPLLGWLHVIMWRQYDQGIAECEKAIALSPNLDVGYIWKGFILAYAGRPEEAVRFCKQALRLNPIPHGWFFRALGVAYAGAGNYEEAIAAFKKSLQRAPNDILTHADLAVTYSWAGRPEEARAQVGEALGVNPKFSLDELAKWVLYKSPADRERYLDGLRKAGLPEQPPLPLPDKPSIAVLPFVNMSGDPEQEYFSDGMTEQIITALSKSPDLFVISRSSTFTYKGKSVKAQQVSRDLGVRYVVEGSVQKTGDQVRITAQLIDAKTGHHFWAESYDRQMKDIFALQDEITIKIMSSLRVKLLETREGELTYAGKGTKNLQAYLKSMKAFHYFARGTPDDYSLARRLAEEANALDPEYPSPYVILAWTHLLDAMLGTSKSPRKSMGKAFRLAQKLVEMTESSAPAHVMLGNVYAFNNEHEKAIAEFERAVALDPNYALGYMFLANTLTSAGRPEEAIPLLKKSMRLSPLSQTHASMCLVRLGRAYRTMGKYEEALSALKKALDIRPNFFAIHTQLAATYIHLGREEEARAAAAEVRRIAPKFCIKSRPEHYKNQEDIERFKDALRKAGLPYCPPRRGSK